ncbi:MAG TPA: MBL fold metallo-hydrolase [Polyangiaceae bacterium]|nr:MBL fold metallo-hydrolase [Polyangiaceae bacterium]
MRIHHLNCVSACPLGGILMDGVSAGRLRARIVSHCLLVELADSLLLVDTGYGLRDVAAPRSRISPFFRALMKPELREEMTAVRQIESLGFTRRDVRHVVLSHLDFDHAGGLDDFPEATVHLLTQEREAAFAQKTTLDRMRYRPAQWGSRDRWCSYPPNQGELWFGFDAVRGLEGVGEDVLLVPLIGHTFGHAGVAIRDSGHWLLYAGDAYFFHAEMSLDNPHCTPGLALYQTLMEKDRSQRLANQQRLRALKAEQGSRMELFCAHDLLEFERMSAESSRQPTNSRVLPAGIESGVGGAQANQGRLSLVAD